MWQKGHVTYTCGTSGVWCTFLAQVTCHAHMAPVTWHDKACTWGTSDMWRISASDMTWHARVVLVTCTCGTSDMWYTQVTRAITWHSHKSGKLKWHFTGHGVFLIRTIKIELKLLLFYPLCQSWIPRLHNCPGHFAVLGKGNEVCPMEDSTEQPRFPGQHFERQAWKWIPSGWTLFL